MWINFRGSAANHENLHTTKISTLTVCMYVSMYISMYVLL